VLLPKRTVFIVHGHQKALLEAVKKELKACQAQRYRVRGLLIDDGFLATRASRAIEDDIGHAIQSADAAIILCSADDLGASIRAANRLTSKRGPQTSWSVMASAFRPRARQNVVLELGMVLRHLDHNRVLVMSDCKGTLERPSDLCGRFIPDRQTPSTVRRLVRSLVKKIALQDSPRGAPEAGTQSMSYLDDLERVGELPVITFSQQFDALDCDGDRALFLAERVVFNKFIQDDVWWRRRLNQIHSRRASVSVTKEIVTQVLSYMRAWDSSQRPISMIEAVARRLDTVLERLTSMPYGLNPIVHVLANNYCGLAWTKVGEQAAQAPDRRRAALRRACKRFNVCVRYVRKFDDRVLRLWEGYVLFNRARARFEISKLSGRRRGEEYDWLEDMIEAFQARQFRLDLPSVPALIADGLAAEYFYLATQLRNHSHHVSASRRVALAQLDELEVQYDAWLQRPRRLEFKIVRKTLMEWERSIREQPA